LTDAAALDLGDADEEEEEDGFAPHAAGVRKKNNHLHSETAAQLQKIRKTLQALQNKKHNKGSLCCLNAVGSCAQRSCVQHSCVQRLCVQRLCVQRLCAAFVRAVFVCAHECSMCAARMRAWLIFKASKKHHVKGKSERAKSKHSNRQLRGKRMRNSTTQ
jgi:hypothetical protein